MLVLATHDESRVSDEDKRNLLMWRAWELDYDTTNLQDKIKEAHSKRQVTVLLERQETDNGFVWIASHDGVSTAMVISEKARM